jgi:CheY-like chemotaxis protein
MDSHEFARSAQDLNNVLRLLAYRSEQLLRSLDEWDPLRKAIQEIDSDISRAVPLVQKLVADGEARYFGPPKLEARPDTNDAGTRTHLELTVVPLAKYKLSNPQKPKLLYVDDHPERLVVLKAVLESTGYEVFTASTGLQGLELFLAESIDLVVLDYYMPSMDGGAVATKMRRLRPNVPIIIFSGALTMPELVIAMVDGFISTSEEPEMLLEKIAELLDQVQAQAS